MKRILALTLCLLTITGCVANAPEDPLIPVPDKPDQPVVTPDPPPAPQPDPKPQFTAETLPRLDGSTATIPLSEGIVSALLDYDAKEAAAFVRHNTTHSAYVNLTEGKCDLIFVTWPSEDEWAMLGDQYEVVRVVKDAFVFLNNKENPVEGLTLQQLRDVYRGKITDWADLGGSPGAIIPYQRPENSGSQTLFHKLILDPKETMAPPMGQVIGDMGGLIDAVASYDNGAAALGYSVFYYASDMYTSDRSRLLAVDGIYPTAETISAEQYPLWDGYYAVFKKSEPENGAVRTLLSWLLSEPGQQVAVQQGYVHN